MPDSSAPARAHPEGSLRHWPLPLLVALLAGAAIIATLDSSGAVPWLGEGPGLTLDETFNVQMGVYHVRAAREYGLALLSFESIREIFGAEVYNPDHPPLGRILIGLAHELSWPLLNPDVPPHAVAVTCGRVGSACAFALTIFLVGWMTSRWYGRAAGLIAAISMVLMPRLFAHAHIAALETFVGLSYAATVLYVADRWTGERRPSWRAVLIGGMLFGLALLTKIQAVLLPIPIAVWALWYWRWRAILPLAVFGLTGLAVFFLGWPWLWIDPIAHLREYFGRTTERLTLYCWYMDQKWADTDVPWHYPLVMFAVTVPVGLHALGLTGLCRGWRSSPAPNLRVPSLIALNVFWPLVFFALPGITVYDGARLFLMVFPLWAVFIGWGAQCLWDVLVARGSRTVAITSLTAFLALQSYGVLWMHPVQLSYYNLLVGGLRGASRLGFEVTYWGDSLTRSLLDEVKPEWADGPVFVAPVLHPFQLKEIQSQTPELDAQLLPFDEARAWDVRRLIVIRRRADSWPSLTPAPPESRLHAEIHREGVQLAGFYEVEHGAFDDEAGKRRR